MAMKEFGGEGNCKMVLFCFDSRNKLNSYTHIYVCVCVCKKGESREGSGCHVVYIYIYMVVCMYINKARVLHN